VGEGVSTKMNEAAEKMNNLTQRRQGAKPAKNDRFVLFAPLLLCAFA
jgi:hypothetical protein